MRLPRALRQIVFGVDHVRRIAFRTGQRLERISPLGSAAQVESAQVLGLTPPCLPLTLGGHRSAADAGRRRALRHQRKRQRRIAGHPLDDRDEFVGVVTRPRHELQRMAVRAAADRRLLIVGAGKARKPLGVGQLRREVARPAQLQIGHRGPLRHDRRRRIALEVVPDRSDAQRVLTRLEPCLRKSIASLAIGDDRDRHGAAGSFGADHHPFHRTFFRRRDHTGQRGRLLRLRA